MASEHVPVKPIPFRRVVIVCTKYAIKMILLQKNAKRQTFRLLWMKSTLSFYSSSCCLPAPDWPFVSLAFVPNLVAVDLLWTLPAGRHSNWIWAVPIRILGGRPDHDFVSFLADVCTNTWPLFRYPIVSNKICQWWETEKKLEEILQIIQRFWKKSTKRKNHIRRLEVSKYYREFVGMANFCWATVPTSRLVHSKCYAPGKPIVNLF